MPFDRHSADGGLLARHGEAFYRDAPEQRFECSEECSEERFLDLLSFATLPSGDVVVVFQVPFVGMEVQAH